MANVPERIPPRELRASDADRERIAAILRQAAADGRLGLDEVEERLASVYAARTYGELEPLTRDLPATAATVPAVAGATDQVPRSGGNIAVMSGFRRRGRWVVPRTFTCLAFWGGGELDLREAHFAAGEVTIRAFAVMGGITVIVPEEAEVRITGLGLMGGFDHGAGGVGAPGAPRIAVRGFSFWGGVIVRRKATDEERRRRKLERRQRRLERGETGADREDDED